MTIRESIANWQAGDPPLVVEHRHQADYVLALAKETGHVLVRERAEGAISLRCIAVGYGSALAWLKKLRIQREAKRKWYQKNKTVYDFRKKLRRCGVADTGTKSLTTTLNT